MALHGLQRHFYFNICESLVPALILEVLKYSATLGN